MIFTDGGKGVHPRVVLIRQRVGFVRNEDFDLRGKSNPRNEVPTIPADPSRFVVEAQVDPMRHAEQKLIFEIIVSMLKRINHIFRELFQC